MPILLERNVLKAPDVYVSQYFCPCRVCGTLKRMLNMNNETFEIQLPAFPGFLSLSVDFPNPRLALFVSVDGQSCQKTQPITHWLP